MGKDGDCGRAIGGLVGLGLEDIVGDTLWVFEIRLTPEVCKSLVFPECALALHVASINVLSRPYLLVHRHAEQWSQREIYGAEEACVDVVEVVLRLVVVKVLILARIHIKVDGLYVVGNDGVYHVVLDKIEIVAIAHVIVLKQLEHIGLGKWREEQGKLLVVVAVAGVERHFEILVCHHGIVAFAEIARLVVQLSSVPSV